MIGDRGVDRMARGGQIGHQSAEAEAHHPDLPGRALDGTRGGQRRHHVADADIAIIGRIEREPFLPFLRGPAVEVDAGFLTPEQVGRDRDEPVRRKLAAGLTNILIHAEDLLEYNDNRRGAVRRPGDIGREFAAFGCYADRLVHHVLRA